MKIVSDLHIHSRFAQACSRSINIANLEKYARMKGLNLLGTGDFAHPLWNKELRSELQEDGSGIIRTKTGFPFILQMEISNMYSQGGKGRRVHNLLYARSFEVVDQIVEALLKKGRLDYDGRPIFGFSCVELVEMMKGIDKDIEIVPAHAWTPWFSVFGSKSGFDSIEECFQDQAKHIHAIETGLSSDPPMNWRISGLDKYTLLSSSDSHSYWPWRIGREANVFELPELTYNNVMSAIKEGDPKRFLYTLEVDPSYGKYHVDGHRECGISMTPDESAKANNICPVCKRPLTIGVLNRVEELADRPEGYVPKNKVPFKHVMPLSEIISSVLGINQLYSKKIWYAYTKLVDVFGSELAVMLDASRGDMQKVVDPKLAGAIVDLRDGKIEIKPGYDGVYGKPLFENVPEKEVVKKVRSQKSLSDFS
ncbi:MAG: endonuclease Q family protein [Candidatus Aenigmatarchaeota archaeon]